MVTEIDLGLVANNIAVIDPGQDTVLLLFTAKLIDRLREYYHVKSHGV